MFTASEQARDCASILEEIAEIDGVHIRNSETELNPDDFNQLTVTLSIRHKKREVELDDGDVVSPDE